MQLKLWQWLRVHATEQTTDTLRGTYHTLAHIQIAVATGLPVPLFPCGCLAPCRGRGRGAGVYLLETW